jgi:thermostable 8-oxoguanine DNA glycosylase
MMTKRAYRIFDVNADTLEYEFDLNVRERDELRERAYNNLSMEDLRRIALWKLDRVLNVPEALLEQLRALAVTEGLTVDSDQSRAVLDALVACDGVGYPMASAFLKFVRSDVYPIIDVRAYRAITGVRLRYAQYSTEVYLTYVERVLEIATRLGRPLADVDEQLYCYDKEHNGSIDD